MNQRIVSSYAKLLNDLRELTSMAAPGVIGIDGAMQQGKTPLAEQLASDLRLPVLHLDSYHSGDGPPYVKKLDVDRLRADLQRGMLPASDLILEGICLLDVLRIVQTRWKALIFFIPEPRSIYADFIDPERAEAEVLETLGTSDAAAIDREILNYQRRAKPHEVANILYRAHP